MKVLALIKKFSVCDGWAVSEYLKYDCEIVTNIKYLTILYIFQMKGEKLIKLSVV